MRKEIQYMKLCHSAANIFSTCAKRRYSAILLDDAGHIVGMGYNGGPKGSLHCSDGGCPRLKNNSPNGSVYDDCIAIHAEANALLHSDYSSRPKKLFVNGPPCFSCAKLIVNSTIDEVCYEPDNNYNDWPKVKSFLQDHGVKLKEVKVASFKA